MANSRSTGVRQLGQVSTSGREVCSTVADAGVGSAVMPGESVMASQRKNGLSNAGATALLRSGQRSPSKFIQPPGPCLTLDAVTANSANKDAGYTQSESNTVKSTSDGVAGPGDPPSTSSIGLGEPVTGQPVQEATQPDSAVAGAHH